MKRLAQGGNVTIAAMSLTAFQELANALDAERSDVHPSEAHGCLSGALCASASYTLREWLDEVLPDAADRDPADPALAGFSSVYATTVELLAEGEMSFEPLLPDDEQPLGPRAEALGLWCHGFLFGFGSTGLARNESMPPDVEEVLADFSQLARAAEDFEADAEEQEGAYAELVEFVRASGQLVYEELAVRRQQLLGGGQTH
jgi:uncharacterized protein YgfB (UPF0149 family)